MWPRARVNCIRSLWVKALNVIGFVSKTIAGVKACRDIDAVCIYVYSQSSGAQATVEFNDSKFRRHHRTQCDDGGMVVKYNQNFLTNIDTMSELCYDNYTDIVS